MASCRPTQPLESSSLSSTLPTARARTAPTKQAGISPTEPTEPTEPSGREAPPTDAHGCAQIRRVWHPAVPRSLWSPVVSARRCRLPEQELHQQNKQGYRPQNARNAQKFLAEKSLQQIARIYTDVGGYGILPYPRCLRNPVVSARRCRLSEQELHQQNKQGYRPQNARNILAEKHLPQNTL